MAFVFKKYSLGGSGGGSGGFIDVTELPTEGVVENGAYRLMVKKEPRTDVLIYTSEMGVMTFADLMEFMYSSQMGVEITVNATYHIFDPDNPPSVFETAVEDGATMALTYPFYVDLEGGQVLASFDGTKTQLMNASFESISGGPYAGVISDESELTAPGWAILRQTAEGLVVAAHGLTGDVKSIKEYIPGSGWKGVLNRVNSFPTQNVEDEAVYQIRKEIDALLDVWIVDQGWFGNLVDYAGENTTATYYLVDELPESPIVSTLNSSSRTADLHVYIIRDTGEPFVLMSAGGVCEPLITNGIFGDLTFNFNGIISNFADATADGVYTIMREASSIISYGIPNADGRKKVYEQSPSGVWENASDEIVKLQAENETLATEKAALETEKETLMSEKAALEEENAILESEGRLNAIKVEAVVEDGEAGVNFVRHALLDETDTGISLTDINDKSITTIVIPDCVTNISSGVFNGCSALESITLPFVGLEIKKASDTYQYPFGSIFGTTSYDNAVATKQNYYGSSTSTSTNSTYYIPSSLKSVVVTGGGILPYAFENCSGLTSVVISDGVTGIGKRAFFSCTGLTSITIPDSVTSIGYQAFYGCTGLTSITIPDGVTSIGQYAFRGCTGLTSITIPDSVTSIEHYAFEDCSSLTSITIPGSVTSIGQCAFQDCTGLTTVTIQEGVTTIGSHAFSGCTGLTSITIPDSVTMINSNAFEGCSSLTSITLPDNIKTVSGGLFKYCTGLTSVTIPDGVTSIRSSAFDCCRSLTSITIPDSVTSIGDSAFYGCRGLTSITIPDSVTSIGKSAFYNCTDLTSITIPDSVTSIGQSAFWGCTGLTAVYISDLSKWCGISFAQNSNPLLYAHNLYLNGELVTDPVIPDSVTSIGNYAFEDCSSLTSITIPDSVTSIGNYAFEDCSSLTSITIPDSVTSIGTSAFEGCSSLTSITIPDGVTSISYSLFKGCTGLTSIDIPDSVTSIDNNAFEESGLTSITIPDSVTIIYNYAFQNCSSLTSIDIPDSVTSIGNYAFAGSGLTSVAIPAGVTGMGNYTFQNCTSLTSVTISDGVTSLGRYTFDGCSSLVSITIPDSVTGIGESVFQNCARLTSIDIPDSVKSIGPYAFSSCPGLTSITIPDSVTIIHNNAFYGCYSLTTIDIPGGVTSIGRLAFAYSGLTSVVIGDGVTSIGQMAFQNCPKLFEVYNLSSTITITAGSTGNGYVGYYAKAIHTSKDTPSILQTTAEGYMFYEDEDDCYLMAYVGDEVVLTLPVDYNGKSYTLCERAFAGCIDLTSVTIPDGITSISPSAFRGCSKLTDITISDSVTSIGDYAFAYSGLTSVVIGDGVTSIGDCAFTNCPSLATVTFPDSVTSIGEQAFYRCASMQYYDFTSHTAVPTLVAIGLAICEIRVPAALYDEWVVAKNWSKYASNITPYDADGNRCCKITNSLTNVTSSATETFVSNGAAFTTTLTAADGYELSTVTVTMGGTDVTADAYADGVVTIASVTGDVVITATATAVTTE